MAEKKANAPPAAGMLWGGRFTGSNVSGISFRCSMLTSRCAGAIDPLMHKYNASIQYDKALYKEDILGSIAFARANSKTGIINEDEFQAIKGGLLQVMEEWKQGTFVIMPNDEDVRPCSVQLNLLRLIELVRFTRQMNVAWERSSARTPRASCTQVAAATSKLSVICACGCAIGLRR